jgi:peptidoglycan/xylan/chitin deacetylase (PgdA/CDA1 family)
MINRNWLSRSLLILVSLFTLAAAASALPSDEPGYSAVVLQYHHFSDETPHSTSTSPELFTRQMVYLSENGFTVWSVDAVVSAIKRSEPLPERCIAITIDDAYSSVYHTAWPILRSHGFPFTVYVPSGAIDDGHGGYMSWDQMRELAAAGVAFGNHSSTHDHLIRRRDGETLDQWRGRMREDIGFCQLRLREELGIEANSFVYPYGEYNLELRNLLYGQALSSFGQQSGCVFGASEFGSLPRFPMSGDYGDMDDFILKVNTLPLPVIQESPEDPTLPQQITKPELKVQLNPGDYQLNQLACFVSGQGRVPIEWIDKDNLIFQVVAPQPLPAGRSRYNFTAPHKNGGRYFWFSHLWIRPGGRENSSQ